MQITYDIPTATLIVISVAAAIVALKVLGVLITGFWKHSAVIIGIVFIVVYLLIRQNENERFFGEHVSSKFDYAVCNYYPEIEECLDKR